ncbi:MAG: hypothetical protein K0S44_2761 [Bacteroidetes bacterium]|jgi:hypothetical protein|nr:hypothetical protein [Bacteroidota bacterium]
MNKLKPFHVLSLFLLTIITTSCSNIKDHNSFFTEQNIQDGEKVSNDYSNGNGWKELGGDYVYYMDVFKTNDGPQMLYIVANKKENKLLGLIHLNRYIMNAAMAKGVSPPTVVTNYEEINPNDIQKANDMTEINTLFKQMPEMKDFKWQTTLQNQIASGIILKTHFIYVTKKTVDEELFQFKTTPVFNDHDKELKEIFSSEYVIYHRDVQRLNQSVDLAPYIKLLGFKFEGTNTQSLRPDKFYINDLIIDDPINFKGKGKMFFFIPFKSFTRPQSENGDPYYAPAIETYEYSITPDSDGYPEFKRNTHFATLLPAAIEKDPKP